MSEWQPIETAPKDGTSILGYCDGDFLRVHNFGTCWSWDNRMASDTNWMPEPTHWQPLPEPPAS